MSRVYASPQIWKLSALTFLLLALTLSPMPAKAFFTGSPAFSTKVYLDCIAAGGKKKTCKRWYNIADPAAIDVTSLTMQLQVDPSLYTFDPAASGPLGAFSVGGDAPPVDPGVGTEAMQLLPTTGVSPGAPLPGSTLTYTNVGGLLTLNYVFSSPVNVGGDVNFFIFAFDFVHPVTIDFDASTVTYATSGPGGDFSQLMAACTTANGDNNCGSPSASTGGTFNFASVPEPSTWAILLLGFGGAGAAMRVRRGSSLLHRR